MTGREIFAQEDFVANDDAGASADIDRDGNDDEAEIDRMYKQAAAAQDAARAAEPESAEKAPDAVPAGLTEQEAEELFDESSDDELLDSLAQDLQAAAIDT